MIGPLPPQLTGARVLVLANNSFSGTLPTYNENKFLRILSIGGNPLLKGPVPESWYTKITFPDMEVLDVGKLLLNDASTKAWKIDFCRNSSKFYSTDSTDKIAQGIKDLLQEVGLTDRLIFAAEGEDLWWLKRDFAMKLLDRIPTDSVQRVQDLCYNRGWPQLLSGLWGGLLALMACAYFARRWLTQKWDKYVVDPGALRPVAHAVSAFFASLYWYDFLTDILLLKDVWPHWPSYVLLAFTLLNFVVSGAVMSAHEFRMARSEVAPPGGIHVIGIMAYALQHAHLALVQYTFGLVCVILLMPLLDTVALLLFVFRNAPIRFLRVDDVDIEAYAHMRDVVKVLATTIPSAIFTSVIYARGNRPEEGLIYTQAIFIASLLASALLVLWVWCTLLYQASRKPHRGYGILAHVKEVLMGRTLDPVAAVATHSGGGGTNEAQSAYGSFGMQLVRATCLLAPLATAIVLAIYKG